MSQSLISVILPVYNVEAYIEKCIESLLSQTYQNFELILVDDCSPDNSVDIAVSLLQKKQFTNYQLLRHTANGGAAVARNTGLEVAKGEYVYFIDNDDWVENTLLTEMISVFNTEDVEIVVCNFWRFIQETGNKEVEFESPLMGVVKPLDAIKALFEEREHAYIWRNLYKRQVFENVRFAEHIVYEDMMTIPLLWANASKIYFLPNFLYNYVKRQDSVINSWKSIDRYYDIVKFMERNEQYFKMNTQFESLHKAIIVYHYIMLRNFSLITIQGGKDFTYYKNLLEQFRSHIKLSSLVQISTRKHVKLILQLLVLKANPYWFWKRFNTGYQQILIVEH